MGRDRKGTVKLHGDHYDARIQLPDGSRPWIHLPPGDTYERAKERAAALSERAAERDAVLDRNAAQVADGETVANYITRRAVDRVARGITSARDETAYLRKHCGRIWERPITAITRDDMEALVEDLDGEVADEATSAGNAKKVWKVIKMAFSDACDSKTRALRVLTSNPALGVRGPDGAPHRSKAWLYPSEFLTLVNCAGVPRHHRRTYALGVYLYARINEIRAIGLEDVDPEHDLVHVHRSLDRATREEKSTKSGRARRMPVEPNIAPLVRVLYAEAKAAGGDHLVTLSMVDWARRLREDLRTAGITRAELLADDKTRQPLRFHDLRATGITWAGIRGDDPLKIRQRAGHAKFATTELYLRTAETVGPGFGEPFPALPDDLLLPDAAPAASMVLTPNASRHEEGGQSPAAVPPSAPRRRGGGRGSQGGGGQSRPTPSAPPSATRRRGGRGGQDGGDKSSEKASEPESSPRMDAHVSNVNCFDSSYRAGDGQTVPPAVQPDRPPCSRTVSRAAGPLVLRVLPRALLRGTPAVQPHRPVV